MLFISEYTFRPNMNKDDTAKLMTLFGQRGAEPGTIAHYVKADGTGGVVILDQEDAVKAFEGTLAYAEYLDFKVSPVITIEDALAPIAAYIG
jgi:hypothetical protein